MEIARVFLNTNLCAGFDRLKEILRDAKIRPDTLSDKSFIVFINRRGTKFKLLVGTSYLVYYSNGEKRFPLEAISRLPECFDGTAFDFNKAIYKTLTEKLKIKDRNEIQKKASSH